MAQVEEEEREADGGGREPSQPPARWWPPGPEWSPAGGQGDPPAHLALSSTQSNTENVAANSTWSKSRDFSNEEARGSISIQDRVLI